MTVLLRLLVARVVGSTTSFLAGSEQIERKASRMRESQTHRVIPLLVHFYVLIFAPKQAAAVSRVIDRERHRLNAVHRRPGREVQRVNVDFPVELLRAIDREAKRVGVSRQAFIKLRLADALAASP